MPSLHQAFGFQPSACIISFNPCHGSYSQFASKEIEALVNLHPPPHCIFIKRAEGGIQYRGSMTPESVSSIPMCYCLVEVPRERGMRTQLPADHRRTGGPSCGDGPHLSQAPCLPRSPCPNGWNPRDLTEWGSLSTGLARTNDPNHPDLPLTVLFWLGSFSPPSSRILVLATQTHQKGGDRDLLTEAGLPCLWHPPCPHRPMPLENLTGVGMEGVVLSSTVHTGSRGFGCPLIPSVYTNRNIGISDIQNHISKTSNLLLTEN